jgi:hypothetical protein
LRIGIGVIVLALLCGVVGYFAGWFATGKDVVSPQNFKAQYQFAYTNDQSLGAIARQYCNSKVTEDAESNPDNKSQIRMQTTAHYNNYVRVAGEYNAARSNLFQGKYVWPPDLPKLAMTLEEKVAQLRQTEGLQCGNAGQNVTVPPPMPSPTT